MAAISFWEVAMLVAKQHLSIQMEVTDWRFELLQVGLLELPLLGTTAIRAARLPSFHGDSADRMIVATAIESAATLMTVDEKILSWTQFHFKIDARL